MKKLTGGFVSFSIIILAIILGKYLAKESDTRTVTIKPQPHKSVNESTTSLIGEISTGLEVFAKDINDRAPFMIDESMRLDRVYVMPMARLAYEISFPYLSASEIDIDSIATDYRREIVHGACSSKEMIPTIDRGAEFIYLLHDKDGVELMEISVSKRECASMRR